jgi:hypothetical protein
MKTMNKIMNNTIINTVTEHKHLGLQLSDDGNWNKHITFIRPLLEYADVVWDTKTQPSV